HSQHSPDLSTFSQNLFSASGGIVNSAITYTFAARSENASCWAATRSQVAIRSSTLPVPAHVLQTSRRIFVGWTLLTYSTPPYFFTFGTSVAMVRFPAQVGQMVIGQDTFRMNWLGANGLSAGVGCGGRTPS